MPHRALRQIGLSQKEAEVYETLLKIGESPVADLIKATNDHPQIIYRALDGLNAIGLIITTYRRHRRYVRAEDPKVLEKIEESKLKEIRKIIPDLAALQKNSSDAIVRISKGNEALRSLRIRAYDELAKDEVYYVIGASGDRYYEIMGDLQTENERKRIKKGVIKRMISFKSQKELLEQQNKYSHLTEYRYLAEEFSVPSTTIIFNETAAIIIWNPEPIVITIESPEVAESYRHYFESLWQIAKP